MFLPWCIFKIAHTIQHEHTSHHAPVTPAWLAIEGAWQGGMLKMKNLQLSGLFKLCGIGTDLAKPVMWKIRFGL